MKRKQIIESTIFCDLPDEVVEHIFSFLPIQDLARVRRVSTRFSKLHPSSLSLSLDESSNAAKNSTCELRKQLLGYLVMLLIRRGCYKLQCFRFSWCYHDHDKGKPESHCPKDPNSLLVKFINYAVRCNVEELLLKVNGDREQTPYVVFPVVHCESLRHLSVKGMYTHIETHSSPFPNLERLELKQVRIPDEEIFEWISHSCKCIKELRLEDIFGTEIMSACIESSSLKSFTFSLNKDYPECKYDLYITCEKLEDACIHLGPPGFSGKLCFTAPNLKNLKWSGHLMMFQNLGKAVSLEKAEIDLDPRINDFTNVSSVFHSIRGAKVLDLTEQTMKCLYKGGLTPQQLQLHDVSSLKIRGLSLKDNDVPAMVYLLNNVRNLATLHIEAGRNNASRYKSSCCSHYSDWGAWEKLAVNNLKEVTIQLSPGDNGISFSLYIRHNALQLQKMVIYYLQEQYSELVMRYNKPTASSAKVNVVFREREEYERKGTVFDFLDRDVAPPKKLLIHSYGSITKSVFEDFQKHAVSSRSSYW